MSLRKKEAPEFETMGQALGIPDSGLLVLRESTQVIDPKEPLDKLLLNKRFRQSFMAFADRFFLPKVNCLCYSRDLVMLYSCTRVLYVCLLQLFSRGEHAFL